MKKNKKLALLIAVVAALVCIGGIAFFAHEKMDKSSVEDVLEEAYPKETKAQTQPVGSGSAKKSEDEIPVDFDKLKKTNADIYAWIDVPDTEISYPIAQNAEDDEWYLHHDIKGNYLFDGTLYTEHTYNGTDFQDPVTVIYGHDSTDGSSMFATLQQHAQELDLTDAKASSFSIYTPDQALTYRIVAAVPHTDEHIMYYNDFTKEAQFNSFFNQLAKSSSMNANINKDAMPKFGDKVVILATCLKGNHDQRFLVVGVLQ